MNLPVLLGLVKQGVPVVASAAGEHVAPGVPEETAEEVWGQETDLAIINQGENLMAYKILESCGCCGVCVDECPVQAISPGDDIFVIDEKACVDCNGYYDEPACINVCPMDCIVKMS